MSKPTREEQGRAQTRNGFLHRARDGDVAAMQSFVRLEIDHGSSDDQEPANLGGKRAPDPTSWVLQIRLSEGQPQERTRSNHTEYSSGQLPRG
jgi:hypothetical protein